MSLVLAGALILGSISVPEADEPSNACGAIALFYVLKEERKSLAWEHARAVLFPVPPGGYSFEQLREGSARLGCELEFADIGREPDGIDRPMIARLDRSGRGHFVALFPIGHTGRLVQVMDPLTGPFVLDKSQVVASPSWSGRILRVARPRMRLFIGAGFLVISTALLWKSRSANRETRATRDSPGFLGG